MARVLIPIPRCDFDPTETGVPWRVLTARGHEVMFATPDSAPGEADELMLTGEGLDVWGWMPLLRKITLVGGVLRANADARAAYSAMSASGAFRKPLRWDSVDAGQFDAILFPGGHRARGMCEYLESPKVQSLAIDAFARGMPVGAICHGVIVLARSIGANGRSVLHGRKTTALTWKLENAGDAIANVTRFWDPHYYRTYRDPPGKPAGFMSVQQEVTRALGSADDFIDVPADDPEFKRRTAGTVRDSEADRGPGFVVRDGNYVSARWPGDAHGFAHAFADLL